MRISEWWGSVKAEMELVGRGSAAAEISNEGGSAGVPAVAKRRVEA